MSPEDTVDSVDLIRLLYVGNDGVTRGYVANAEDIERLAEDGMNLATGMQSFNSLDHLSPSGPYGPAGAVRLIPDLETFCELPYAERSGSVLCTIEDHDGTPWEADPRSTLEAFLDSQPWTAKAAFESEFYLITETEDGIEPFDDTVCFSPEGMQNTNDIALEIIDALEAQGMDFVTYYPEYGPGQQEFVISYDEAMQAADNHVRLENTVKGVAANNELQATFLPKPFEDAAGSGCHIHISLWDDDKNTFYDSSGEDPYSLSKTARHFVGGILEHAPALLALTAPSITSYRRLRPGMWASAYSCWGFDNREALVRIPFATRTSPEDSTRIEFKAGDNTMNPYLALLGLLAAGSDGIDRELDPGAPLDTDPAALSDSERDEQGIERLPETLGDAIDALAENDVLADALGDGLYESYLDVKRSQWDEFAGETTDWEIDQLRRPF